MTPSWLRQDGRDWLLLLRVQPRASSDGIAGLHENRLKIRISAPPVDGKANLHLQRLLAEWLDLPRAKVRIEQGETGRDKRVRLIDVGPLPARLREIASQADATSGPESKRPGIGS